MKCGNTRLALLLLLCPIVMVWWWKAGSRTCMFTPLKDVPTQALPAYVISVPGTRSRDIMKDRFRGKVHNVHIFDGVDGTRVPQRTDKLRPGQLGCALSHMRLWALAQRTGAPAVLVFEDDAEPVHDFRDRLAGILPHIDDSVDMVFLGHCAEKEDGAAYAPGLRTSKHPRCTHGYLVTRRGARKLVRWATQAKLEHPIDEMLAREIFYGNIRALSCFPPLVNAAPDESVIDKMGWQDSK